MGGSTISSRNTKRFIKYKHFYNPFFLSLFRARTNNLEEYPLHVACQNGQIEVVGKLLQEFSPVTLEHDMNRWSPLHHAAW